MTDHHHKKKRHTYTKKRSGACFFAASHAASKKKNNLRKRKQRETHIVRRVAQGAQQRLLQLMKVHLGDLAIPVHVQVRVQARKAALADLPQAVEEL